MVSPGFRRVVRRFVAPGVPGSPRDGAAGDAQAAAAQRGRLVGVVVAPGVDHECEPRAWATVRRGAVTAAVP